MGVFDTVISKLSTRQSPKTSDPNQKSGAGKISLSDPEFQEILEITKHKPHVALQFLGDLLPYLSDEAMDQLQTISVAPKPQAPKTVTGTETDTGTGPQTVAPQTVAPQTDTAPKSDAPQTDDTQTTLKTPKTRPPISNPTTLEEVASLQKTDLDKYPNLPQGGPQASPILKGPLGKDWFLTKSLLLDQAWPTSVTNKVKPDPEVMGLLMDKLIALRAWEYDTRLTSIRDGLKSKFPGKADKDVLSWSSAGSGARTSDVDLNLKGAGNMEAVALFNVDFFNTWGLEAGTVFDVNVYQMDFMHGFNDPTATQAPGVHEYTTKKEIDIGDKTKQETDNQSQEVWSLVKVRRYMDDNQWKDYQKKSGFDPDAPPSPSTVDLAKKFQEVEIRYNKYKTELDQQQLTQQTWEKNQVARLESLGIDAKKAEHFAGAASGMLAANIIYEKKITSIITLRTKLDNLRSTKAPQTQIDDLALELRDLLSEALLFANEAYVTDGAVNHAVVGIQILGGQEGATKRAKAKAEDKQKGSGAQIQSADLTLAPVEFLTSFNENIGDWVKEQTHFLHRPTTQDRVGGAVYKGGKYLQRLGLAADKLPGLDTLAPQKSLTLSNVKELGNDAMTIKGKNSNTAEKDCFDAYGQRGFSGELSTFTSTVIDIGAAVSTAYRSKTTPPPSSVPSAPTNTSSQTPSAPTNTPSQSPSGPQQQLQKTVQELIAQFSSNQPPIGQSKDSPQ